MLVNDWMARQPLVIAPTTSIMEARRLLRRHGIRHLPVVGSGRLVGIVSSHDLDIRDDGLLRGLAAMQSDLVFGRYRPVDEVMTTALITVTPQTTVEHAAQMMVERRIGALPVVEGRRVVGLISITDCVRALLDWHAAAAAIGAAEVLA